MFYVPGFIDAHGGFSFSNNGSLFIRGKSMDDNLWGSKASEYFGGHFKEVYTNNEAVRFKIKTLIYAEDHRKSPPHSLRFLLLQSFCTNDENERSTIEKKREWRIELHSEKECAHLRLPFHLTSTSNVTHNTYSPLSLTATFSCVYEVTVYLFWWYSTSFPGFLFLEKEREPWIRLAFQLIFLGE